MHCQYICQWFNKAFHLNFLVLAQQEQHSIDSIWGSRVRNWGVIPADRDSCQWFRQRSGWNERQCEYASSGLYIPTCKTALWQALWKCHLPVQPLRVPPLICRKRTGRVQETDKSRVHRCNDFFPHPEVGGIARPEYFPNPGLARQDGKQVFSVW